MIATAPRTRGGAAAGAGARMRRRPAPPYGRGPMRQQQAAPPAVPRGRPWLAAAGAALVVAALGTAGLARRYVAAESAQFVVFAMAAPALIVLGAPWRLRRLSGAAAPEP